MSLRFAILGLLSRESLTGYDLTKRFDTTIAFFWSAKHSQIYPELAALTKEGLVTFEVVTQTSKPNKKVYTITDDGRAELTRWIAEPCDKRTVKDPLLLRTWALGTTDPEVVLPHLRDTLVEQEKRLQYLALTEAQLKQEMSGEETAEWRGALMALRAGVMTATAYRDWLKWAIAESEQFEKAAAASL